MSELVYILNGPNLNLLGQREPEIYGHDTLEDVEAACKKAAGELGLALRFLQSNHEGQIVDWIQEARKDAAGITINPAAHTHYSIAVMDALCAFDGPVIEVHISAPHKREAFRQTSYVSHRADAVLSGFGVHGYVLALRHMAHLLNSG